MSQFYPVILEIGSRFIQAGFAGDPYPTVRKQTNSYRLAELDMRGLSHAMTPEDSSQFPNQRYDYKVLWSYDISANDPKRLENVLERIIHDIYTNYLLVDAKRCKVLVIEPDFFPNPLKQIVTKVLLFHMHAISISFYPEPIMACIGAASEAGLVINLGWSRTTITSVYDLRMLYNDIKVTNKGGKLIHDEILSQLKGIEGVPSDNLFEFVERFMYEISYSTNGHKTEEDIRSFKFDGIEIPNKLRYKPVEKVLFGGDEENQDDENMPIIDLVSTSLRRLNIDLRSSLPTKIIIIGGLSRIPGVKGRLIKEIENKLEDTTLKIEAIVSLGAWQGASIYCSTSLMSPSTISGSFNKANELQRDRYLAGEAPLLDWTDMIYDT